MVDLVKANHTSRELDLMLNGNKPLAMFYAEASELPEEEFIPEIAFAPYVSSGVFMRGEFTLDTGYADTIGRNAIIKYVLFARAPEAWRIQAMQLLKQSYSKSRCRWNEALERIEGTLLGYTDEEITAWCRHQTLWEMKDNGSADIQKVRDQNA